MKINKKILAICIAIPLVGGILLSLISGGGMEAFANIDKPPLSPPSILFPVVWTVLYTLMGISSYLIIAADENPMKKADALTIYAYQLIVNLLWPIFFFVFHWYFFSFVWLILLWVMVLYMIIKFFGVSKIAAVINIPYLLWLSFAAYLNFAILLIN